MSENVIIDGVDVAECEFYNIEANELYPKAQYCGSMRNTFCENEPNCYFKQLQRAKAEIEDLKFYIDSYAQVWEVARLRAENEKLKKEIDSLSRLS